MAKQVMNCKPLLVLSYTNPITPGGIQNVGRLVSAYPRDLYWIFTRYSELPTLLRAGTYNADDTTRFLYFDNPLDNEKSIDELKAMILAEKKNRIEIKSIKFRVLETCRSLLRKSLIFREIFGFFAFLGKIFLMVREGGKIIKEKNIGLMIAITDGGTVLCTTYLLSKLTGVPYYVEFLDIYKENRLAPLEKLFARFFEPILFRNAAQLIVTNQGTKEFYEKQYGSQTFPFVVIHNSTPAEPYEPLITPYEPKPPYTIVFSGSVYWAQLQGLQNLIKAVQEITDIDVRLDIYATKNPQQKDLLTAVSCPRIRITTAPPEDMPRIQTKADILFVSLSWQTDCQPIIDTATPGKLSDYLIAGRPMLVHSPASSYLSRYAREEKFGEVVDQDDVEALKQAIRKLLTDIPYSRKLVENARKTFYKNHNTKLVARQFVGLACKE